MVDPVHTDIRFDEELRRARETRALIVGPYLSPKALYGLEETARPSAGAVMRSPAARLEEAVGLARAIDVDVVSSVLVMLSQIRPATYIGSGKIDEIKALVESYSIGLVMVDCALSPVQQRNLEKALDAKVIDRTGLILEIFGRRARTREGRLQVELAHLTYQKSRLVRSWTHLERQRGGFGFMGGPGESQIEIDRRLLQERMTRIERDLHQVQRTRGLHRKKRQDVPYPVVALVGYTNAGKSTLFNHLTQAEVLAQDMLFATLDPTLRGLKLPHGARVMLSDTVGFISDLPTMLVSAFRATLEEVVEADIILHVRDISHEDSDAQSTDVQAILRELGIDPHDHARLIEVWNKSDLLGEAEHVKILNSVSRRAGDERPFVVSALSGEGINLLLAGIEERLMREHAHFNVRIGVDDGAALNWLYEHAHVLHRDIHEDGSMIVRIRIAQGQIERLQHRFAGVEAITGD
jgi:GTPase